MDASFNTGTQSVLYEELTNDVCYSLTTDEVPDSATLIIAGQTLHGCAGETTKCKLIWNLAEAFMQFTNLVQNKVAYRHRGTRIRHCYIRDSGS